MSKKIRAFIAIPIENSVKKKIAEIQDNIKTNNNWEVKWVKPDNIHLTLKFLGDINSEDINQVENSLVKSVKNIKKFSLKIKGVGVFPNLNKPRVIWVGINDSNSLIKNLYKRIENNMHEIGFLKEKRSFNPHLTIGRIKNNILKSELKQTLIEYDQFNIDFICDSVLLYKSVLKPTGSEYSVIADIPLT